MKNLKVLSLLLLTLIFSGCPDDQLEKEMKTIVKNESTAFQNFYNAREARGDVALPLLKQWSKQVGNLNVKLLTLLTLAEKHPEIKLDSLKNYAILKESIDLIYKRPQVIVVPNIPEWSKYDAYQTHIILKGTFRSLREHYIALFGRDPSPYDNLLLIEFQTDEKIYDTLADCAKQMTLFSQNLIDAKNDASCLGIYGDYCGHQTDLACMQSVLDAHHNTSCSVLVDEAIDPNNPNIVGTVAKQKRAPWLKKLKPCFQAKKIIVK